MILHGMGSSLGVVFPGCIGSWFALSMFFLVSGKETHSFMTLIAQLSDHISKLFPS